MKRAWLFKSGLVWLSEMKKRLDGKTSKPWIKLDSDTRLDCLVHAIRERAQIVIYDYGKAFVVTLDADADELGALKQLLMDDLLPAIDAREIVETDPPRFD